MFNNCFSIDEMKIVYPLAGRGKKPRTNGLTMVIDKGLDEISFHNLLKNNHNYMDYLKLAFGSMLLYPKKLLKYKIKVADRYGIKIYAGGTLFEIAHAQGVSKEYFRFCKKIGISVVEISNGTIDLPVEQRRKSIKLAKEYGLEVLTEVGKKNPEESLSLNEMIDLIIFDIENGADKVIIEARESGKNISLFDQQGEVEDKSFTEIVNKFKDKLDLIIWEAPLKRQQVYFIKHLGNNVNLGNIRPDHIYALESLRCGLRGDTFRIFINK